MNRRALVIGASGGIGRALTEELRARAFQVTGFSRSVDGFEITNEASIERSLSDLEPGFDLMIVATGILSGAQGPEKSIRAVNAQEMAHLFAVNTIGPALVLKHCKRLMPKNQRAVFAVLSARVGSIGDNTLGGWYSYRASKAALNQVIRTASIELKRTHPHFVCVAMQPGTVRTNFTRNYPQHQNVSATDAARNLLDVIDGLASSESGGFLDWAGKTVPW